MGTSRLPLFPLGIVLLPGEPVPLHIFEPRYKEMVRVCTDEERPFGIVYASENRGADIGCTALIERVAARYNDGRLGVLLKRLKKARDLRSLARGDGQADGFPELGTE